MIFSFLLCRLRETPPLVCKSVLLLGGRRGAWSSNVETRLLPPTASEQDRRLSVHLSIGLRIYYFLVFNEATVYNNDL